MPHGTDSAWVRGQDADTCAGPRFWRSRTRSFLARRAILDISTPQLEALRARLAAAAARTSARPDADADDGAGPAIAVGRVGLCLLADFPQGAVAFDADLVAGALARIDGPLCATALLAMAPEDALGWVRGDWGRDRAGGEIERFLALAGEVLRDCTAALAQAEGAVAALDATLAEDPVVAILLATHAPSDTLVLSAELLVADGETHRPTFLAWMLDAKGLMGLLPEGSGSTEG